MTISSDHPLKAIKMLADSQTQELEFEFSLYEYKPQSILDTRTTFTLPATHLTNETIERIIKKLNPNEELAIHSKVRIGKKVFHIPMIDFKANIPKIKDSLKSIQNTLPSKIYKEILFYNSGRSCHAYSLKLITQKEWHEYMGRLLLISQPNEEQIIDTRWVGHRLMAGYASLRWSNNTNNHIHAPKELLFK